MANLKIYNSLEKKKVMIDKKLKNELFIKLYLRPQNTEKETSIGNHY